jgi:site-specific recombinase XerD
MGGDPVVAWVRSMRRRGLVEGTIEKRTSVARRLSAHAGVELLAVTTEDVETWLDSRTVTARTRYTDISHVSAFFRWAIREDLVEADPTARIDRPKVRSGLPRPIDTDELRYALRQSTSPELTAMLHLAAFDGLRCAEIAHLNVEDINGDMMLVHGKGGKDRVLPVHPLVRASLSALSRPAYGSMFGLEPWQVSHAIRRHLTDCGIRASAHQLRHWFATAAYEASGNDLRMVQELLGHSSPTTTAIYTRWSRTRSVDVVASMSA